MSTYAHSLIKLGTSDLQQPFWKQIKKLLSTLRATLCMCVCVWDSPWPLQGKNTEQPLSQRWQIYNHLFLSPLVSAPTITVFLTLPSFRSTSCFFTSLYHHLLPLAASLLFLSLFYFLWPLSSRRCLLLIHRHNSVNVKRGMTLAKVSVFLWMWKRSADKAGSPHEGFAASDLWPEGGSCAWDISPYTLSHTHRTLAVFFLQPTFSNNQAAMLRFWKPHFSIMYTPVTACEERASTLSVRCFIP